MQSVFSAWCKQNTIFMMCWLDRSTSPCSNIGLQFSVNNDVDALYLSQDWKSQQKMWILAQERTKNNLFETMQIQYIWR